MGGTGRVSRASLGSVLFFGFILFLFVLDNQTTKKTTTIRSNASLKLTGAERRAVHWSLDINYVSKRRVPNGPDPIHNRRAGKSREPPSRA